MALSLTSRACGFRLVRCGVDKGEGSHGLGVIQVMVLLSLNDLRSSHGVIVVLVVSNCRAAGGARTTDVADQITHTQAATRDGRGA